MSSTCLGSQSVVNHLKNYAYEYFYAGKLYKTKINPLNF